MKRKAVQDQRDPGFVLEREIVHNANLCLGPARNDEEAQCAQNNISGRYCSLTIPTLLILN